MLMYLTVNLKYTFHIYKIHIQVYFPCEQCCRKIVPHFSVFVFRCLVFMLKKKCSEIVNVICFEI